MSYISYISMLTLTHIFTHRARKITSECELLNMKAFHSSRTKLGTHFIKRSKSTLQRFKVHLFLARRSKYSVYGHIDTYRFVLRYIPSSLLFCGAYPRAAPVRLG